MELAAASEAAALGPVVRARSYDAVIGVILKRVKESAGRMSAKRLQPIAVAAGYQGSPRNLRGAFLQFRLTV